MLGTRKAATGLALPQHRVDQAGGGTLTRGFDHLHRFVDHRSFGDFVKEHDLVDPQPQDRRDLRIEIPERLAGEPLDPEVEVAAPAEDAHDQLRYEPAIDLRKIRNSLALQQVHSKGAARLHSVENAVSGSSGG